MNKEILEPVLKELLEEVDELKKGVSLIIKELEIMHKEQREIQTNQKLFSHSDILIELAELKELLIKHSNYSCKWIGIRWN